MDLSLFSRFLLGLTAVLFAADFVQCLFYLPEVDRREGGEHMPHWLFHLCLFLFFAAMVFVILAGDNLPLMWVAIELTTLVSAPLIAYHRSAESLEAMWKYLLICSVGIGLALFGTMIVLHSQHAGPDWFKAGFIFILAGYGTKMGLAPFHTWLPDAHSEAPAPVSALLSGALLNCSFLAIVRVRSIAPAAVAPFCDKLMLAIGLLSVLTAAVFMVRQTDYKRLLAYSSVEHMGVIIVIFAAMGLSPASSLFSKITPEIVLMIHVAAHSFTKTMLFLSAGNLLLAFGTRTIAAVQGLGVTMKGHAVLWMCGVMLICGMPPSLLFVSELGLVFLAPLWLSVTVLLLLFAVFAAMSKVALSMTMGHPVSLPTALPKTLSVVPSALFVALVAAGAVFSLYAAALFVY